MHIFSLLSILAAISCVLANPSYRQQQREIRVMRSEQSAKVVARENSSDLELLSTGNQAFRDNIAATDPGLLQRLADEGQSPPFMFLGCSDSRVSEGTIFNAKPGVLFAERNIANQFLSSDANTQSVLSYSIAALGVKHVIVMGHYGCGGVAGAIASPPKAPISFATSTVQNWIEPIRDIFRTSDRPEIVELRNKNANRTDVEEPGIDEPGFRALIEENVKTSVRRIATNPVIVNHYGLLQASASNSTTIAGRADVPYDVPETLQDVFIHGWVYDIVNGKIYDLGVSVGPPGKAIPPPPFAAVATSATLSADVHHT